MSSLSIRIGYGLALMAALPVMATPTFANVIYQAQSREEIDYVQIGFTLTLPTPLGSTFEYFTPGSELACNQCVSISYYPDAQTAGLAGFASEAFAYTVPPSQLIPYGGSAYLYFAPGVTTEDGTFVDVNNPTNTFLTVSGIPGPVPEPTSAVLLASGLAAIWWVIFLDPDILVYHRSSLILRKKSRSDFKA